MEGQNLILLGLYSMDFVPAKPSNPLLCVPGVNSKLPDVSAENTVRILESLECLVFVQLFRGQPDEASIASDLFSLLMHRNLGECDDAEARSQMARVHTLHSIVILANSVSAKDRASAAAAVVTAGRLMEESQEKEPDPTVLSCLAMHSMAHAQFGDAIGYFHLAATAALASRHRVKQTMALIGQAWSHFLGGRIARAQCALEDVYQFASSASHIPLHVWALELDILIKTLTKDFPGAEEARRIASSMQRRSNYLETVRKHECISATTCAVTAFSMVCNGQFERARPYAYYSCSRLAHKKQGTAVGCVLLFCATYSLLDVVDIRASSSKNSSKTMSTLPARDHKSNSYPDAERSVSVTWREAFQGGSCRSTKQLLLLARESLDSLNQHVLRFPGLIPLVWSLTGRLRRLEGCDFPVLAELLAEIDAAIITNQLILRQFVFGAAYVYLQRSILCNKLDVSYALPGGDDSRRLAKSCFYRMGGSPDILEELGIPEETADSAENASEEDHSEEEDFDYSYYCEEEEEEDFTDYGSNSCTDADADGEGS